MRAVVQDTRHLPNPIEPNEIHEEIKFTECPPAPDGMERFVCPKTDQQGRFRCIDDHSFCDGYIDCPEGAEEDLQLCMLYKTVSNCGETLWLQCLMEFFLQMKAHLNVLADAMLRWAAKPLEHAVNKDSRTPKN